MLGIYHIKCRAIKSTLALIAENIAKALLENIRNAILQSNLRIIDSFSEIASQVGKTCESGEELLQLKKYIQKSLIDQENLEEEIQTNKCKEDFLVDFR